MASYKTAFGSYLKTEDIIAKGGRVNCVIESVAIETIKGQEGKADEHKPVATIRNSDKKLALNMTRCQQLEAIFGSDDMDQWIGPVTIVVGQTKYAGKTVPCMDIHPRQQAVPAPKPVPKPVPPPPPVEEEFDSADITDQDVPF